MRALILASLMTATCFVANAKEYYTETLEQINLAKAYVMAIQSADPVLIAQKGEVKDLQVLKIEELSDYSTRVTVRYFFNDNVNGKKLITDVVLVEYKDQTINSPQSYNTGHQVVILKRTEKDLE